MNFSMELLDSTVDKLGIHIDKVDSSMDLINLNMDRQDSSVSVNVVNQKIDKLESSGEGHENLVGISDSKLEAVGYYRKDDDVVADSD